MITIDPRDLTSAERYRLLTGIVVPRPIAWVTSRSTPDGPVNLAPFSCFTFVCYDPMLVAFVVGRKGTQRKDTAANVGASREFVLHIPTQSDVEHVHRSAAELPSNISEVTELGLPLAQSATIAVPRLRDAAIALECRWDRSITFGEIDSEMVVGEVLCVHARPGLVVDGKLDTMALDPLARVAGPRYTGVAAVREMAPLAASLADRPEHQTSRSAP